MWKIAPKTTFCGADIVNIAIHFVVCTYNDGASSIIRILKELSVVIGSNTLEWSQMSNNIRVTAADRSPYFTCDERRQNRN